MALPYDKYYQTENLLGKPYPELMDFFAAYPEKGKVLDLGCGQGRDAIPLAQLGFEVTGIDNSKVGIDQMNQIAGSNDLPLTGLVADIYSFDDFAAYDFVLLDSMFHFAKKDKKKEMGFVQRILSNSNKGCLIVVCIQDTGKKVDILRQVIDQEGNLELVIDKEFKYTFEDQESGHKSETDYRLIGVKK